MKKRSLLVFICMLILVTTSSCGKQEFVGSRTSNDVQFIMNYSVLNSSRTHEMKLKKGTNINVVIESKSGRVDILVADTKGVKIYKGDNASTGKFTIQIPKTDTYKFTVTGDHAKGSISFKVAD